MEKTNFIKALTNRVQEYIDNFDRFDNNPQLMVNPQSLTVEVVNGSDMLANIADSEEAVEDAVSAQGDESEAATDYQASQDPDFYPVKELLDPTKKGMTVPDAKAIEKIAKKYFIDA